jgi:hypothetical protein
MRKTLRLVHVLPLLLIVVSCSHTPRMSHDQETEYIRMLRREFFNTHPDGQYNEHIKKGEVVKGMDFLEVLASWGNPDKREKPVETVEHWTYREVDESSKDFVQYKFIFKKNVLSDWELSRHFAKGGELNMLDENRRTILIKGANLRTGTGAPPKKK